jgi:hypothetical protein
MMNMAVPCKGILKATRNKYFISRTEPRSELLYNSNSKANEKEIAK